jgi:3-oxoadipate enol-lactonase
METPRPAMLLLRMASGDFGIWDRIRADLAADLEVLQPDLSDHPAMVDLSDPLRLFRTLGESAVDEAAERGHERCHLFGWNGGTLIALAAAIARPERVASMILLDPFFPLPDMRAIERAIEVKRVLFEHPDKRVYASYWVMAGLTDRFIQTHGDVVEQLIEARVAKDRFVRTGPERFMAWVRALRFSRFSDEMLARIEVPVLVLATDRDRWNAGPNVAMAEQLVAHLANAMFQVVEDAGGLFPIEDPDRLHRLLEPFVRRATRDR